MARPEPRTIRLVDEVSELHAQLTVVMDHVAFMAARTQQNDLHRRLANHVNNTGTVGAWFDRSARELKEFAEQQREESNARWRRFIAEIS